MRNCTILYYNMGAYIVCNTYLVLSGRTGRLAVPTLFTG